MEGRNPQQNNHHQFWDLQKQSEDVSASRKNKQVRYKGSGIRMALGFSTVKLETGRKWNSLLKVLRESTYQSGILFSTFNKLLELGTNPQKI